MAPKVNNEIRRPLQNAHDEGEAVYLGRLTARPARPPPILIVVQRAVCAVRERAPPSQGRKNERPRHQHSRRESCQVSRLAANGLRITRLADPSAGPLASAPGEVSNPPTISDAGGRHGVRSFLASVYRLWCRKKPTCWHRDATWCSIRCAPGSSLVYDNIPFF